MTPTAAPDPAPMSLSPEALRQIVAAVAEHLNTQRDAIADTVRTTVEKALRNLKVSPASAAKLAKGATKLKKAQTADPTVAKSSSKSKAAKPQSGKSKTTGAKTTKSKTVKSKATQDQTAAGKSKKK